MDETVGRAADQMNSGAGQLSTDATSAKEDAKTQSVAAEQSIQETGGANTDALTGQADEAMVLGGEFSDAQGASKEGLAAAEENWKQGLREEQRDADG